MKKNIKIGSAKVLLINYSGYWVTSNTFIPDPALALLASCLLENKIDAEIMDFQCPDSVEKVIESSHSGTAIFKEIAINGNCSEEILEKHFAERKQGQEKLEFDIYKTISKKISNEPNIQYLAFKIWAGNGCQGVIKMVKKLRKEFPYLKFIAGGPAIQYIIDHFTPAIQEYFIDFDLLIYGEGEEALTHFVNFTSTEKSSTQGHSSVPVFDNSAVKENGAFTVHPRKLCSDLSLLPHPIYSYDIYPNIESFFKIRIIDESRGCFNKCTFCSHVYITSGQKRGVRKKSVVKVIDEIEKIYNDSGVNFFRFSGSNPPWSFVIELANELIRRKLPISYSMYSSMNNSRADDMALLAQSGLKAIFYGIESGDPEILKSIHDKNNKSREHILNICKSAMAEKIFITLSFIVPSPFETEQSKLNTLDLIKDIFKENNYGSTMILPAFLLPGNQWWHNMEKFGFSFEEGFDKDKFLLQLLEWDSNYLLPKTAATDLGVRLNGKSFMQVMAECQDFINRVNQLGVTTSVDDASFMLGLLGGIDPVTYKNMMTKGLVLGGHGRLSQIIDQVNNRLHIVAA